MLPRDQRGAEEEARPELADIFRQYGESYRKTHFLLASQRKVIRAVSVCRTQELGGHLKQCDTCGFEHPTYNSCRNRHCPKCQSLAKAKWLERQTSELLPVGYFHLVFTLPHEFNRLILAHKKILLALLFKAVSETLLQFGQRRFGGTLGITAVLHILRLSSGQALGSNAQRSFSSTLSDPRRRLVLRSRALDLGAQKLSVSRQSPESGLSWKVSRPVTTGL